MTDFSKFFANVDSSLSPYCLWAVNHRLDSADLSRHIQDFAEKGFRGIVLSASPGTPPVFSRAEWEEAVAHCCSQALSLGLQLWLHFQPTRLLDFGPQTESAAQYLSVSNTTCTAHEEDGEFEWHPAQAEIPLLVYAVRADKPEYGEVWRMGRPLPIPLRWSAPDGTWTLRALVRRAGNGPNIMHGDTIRASINTLLAPLPSEGITGVVADSSSIPEREELTALPWSGVLPDRFQEVHHYSVYDVLPHLFDDFGEDSIPHRAAFWDLHSRVFRESFVEPLTEFCGKQDWELLFLRKTNEENSVSRHPASAVICASPSPPSVPMILSPLSPADVSFRKPLDTDRAWSVQPGYVLRDMVYAAERGCPSPVIGTALYSTEGFRKHSAEPLQSPQSPFWPWYSHITNAAARLTWLFKNSKPSVSVLILDPTESQLRLYPLSSENRKLCADVHELVKKTDLELRIRGISVRIVNEACLNDATVQDRRIHVPELNMEFDGLILPRIGMISEPIERLINRCLDEGVTVSCLSCVPERTIGQDGRIRRSEISAELEPISDIRSFLDRLKSVHDLPFAETTNREIEVFQRDSRWGRFYVLINRSEKDSQELDVSRIPGCGELRLLNVAGGGDVALSTLQDSDDGDKNRLAFEPGQATVLFLPSEEVGEDAAESVSPHRMVTRVEFADRFLFIPRLANLFPLDRWELALNVADRAGGMTSEYLSEFLLVDGTVSMRLLCDGLSEQDLRSRHVEIEVNGEGVSEFALGCRFDRWILKADISGLIRPGANRVTAVVHGRSSPSACLSQAFWLEGDFQVQELDGLDVLGSRDISLTIGLRSWTEQGFPYYCGPAVYRQWVTVPETMRHRRFRLRFDTVKNLIEVRVNKRVVDVLLQPPWTCEISDAVVLGENEFEFVVTNSLDNAFRQAASPSGLIGPVVLEAR